MQPPQRRPHRLPALGDGAAYTTDEQKRKLYAKYGDLTTRVPARVREAAVIYQHGHVDASIFMPTARDDTEYVTRREMDVRISQLEQRIGLLANALRQQDEISQRMSSALDDVMAKMATLQLHASPSGSPGVLRNVHSPSAAIDASPVAVAGSAIPSYGFGAHCMMAQHGGTVSQKQMGAPGATGLIHGLPSFASEEDGDIEGDDQDDDAYPDGDAGHGLEALAGMTTVSAEDMRSSPGVGEAGSVNVSSRGMKQVPLHLTYREPIVLASIIPTRPGSDPPSPQTSPLKGAGCLVSGPSCCQSVVCVPFKDRCAVQFLLPACSRRTSCVGSSSSR